MDVSKVPPNKDVRDVSRKVLSEIMLDDGMTYSCYDYYNKAADKLLTKCDAILNIAQATELLARKIIAYQKEDKNSLHKNSSAVLQTGIGVLEEMIIDPKKRQMHILRPKTVKEALNYKYADKILDFFNYDLDYTFVKFDLEKHLSKLEGKDGEKNYYLMNNRIFISANDFNQDNYAMNFMRWALGSKLTDPKNELFKQAKINNILLDNLSEQFIYNQHNSPAYKNNNRHDLPFLRHVSVRVAQECPNKDPSIYRLIIQVQGVNNSHHPLAGIVYNRKRRSK